MNHPAVARLLAYNQRQAPLRVWSLLITFIGDAVVPHGGEVPLTTMLALTRHLGIEDGTVRVALSRLTRDDWVQRRRAGRHSHYRLSATRQQAFEAASARIYARRVPTAEDWFIAIAPPEESLRGPQAVPSPAPTPQSLPGAWCIDARRGLWLQAGDTDAARPHYLASGWLLADGSAHAVPDWLASRLAPTAIATVLATLRDLLDDPVEGSSPDGLDALACRCLLIHAWRRLALRLPRLPATLLPPDWPESACRDAVCTAWHAYLASSERWLAAEVWPARDPDSARVQRRLARRWT